MSTPKFPHIKVALVGGDGNAFVILAKMSSCLKKGGASGEDVKKFFAAATAGDYHHLLRTCGEWVEVV